MGYGLDIRRHHKWRMKAKALRVYPDQPDAIRLADHLKNCSCILCGNPRRFRKRAARLTLQERRVEASVFT